MAKRRPVGKEPDQTEMVQRARRLANQGAELMHSGQFEQAITVLERAYRLNPDDVPTAINLGGAYVMTKRYKQAVEVLERARDQEPENEMIWINLGAAYLGNPVTATDERQRRALAAFNRALEIDPLAHSVAYNIGLIHRDRGEIELAIAAFRRAVLANPYDRDAQRMLEKLSAL